MNICVIIMIDAAFIYEPCGLFCYPCNLCDDLVSSGYFLTFNILVFRD